MHRTSRSRGKRLYFQISSSNCAITCKPHTPLSHVTATSHTHIIELAGVRARWRESEDDVIDKLAHVSCQLLWLGQLSDPGMGGEGREGKITLSHTQQQ